MVLEVRLRFTLGGISARGQAEVLGVLVISYFLIWYVNVFTL